MFCKCKNDTCLNCSCCSEKLLRHSDGRRIKASCRCDLQQTQGSPQLRILGSLTQHIPQILKTCSRVPSNGKSLPNLESAHWGVERFISLPPKEFSLWAQRLCVLMLHAWIHENTERRVWKYTAASCKYLRLCAYVLFLLERVSQFSKRSGTTIIYRTCPIEAN
jgi:hypothetical protein